MVSSEGLHYNYNKSVKLINTAQGICLLACNLFVAIESIFRAFELIRNESFDLVDLNCGCSVRKIINSGSGATLLKNPDEIYAIIKGLVHLTDKPVTLKIRSGWNHSSINFKEVYQAAYSAGASLITLHPRTKSMLFSGKANWEHIAELKEMSEIPVIGNGDIYTLDDALRMFQETKCDGIMLARGVLENPFLIEEIAHYLRGEKYETPSLEKRFELAKEHLSALITYEGNEEKAIFEFRKFVKGYARNAPGITNLRQAINQATTYHEVSSLFDLFLARSVKNEI